MKEIKDYTEEEIEDLYIWAYFGMGLANLMNFDLEREVTIKPTNETFKLKEIEQKAILILEHRKLKSHE